MRPRYTSNAGIFAKRGDPWVSQREGVKDFLRNPETENPEYDFDHRFHHAGSVMGKPTVAPKRVEHHDPRPVKGDDPLRRKASIARRMNASIARHGKVEAVQAVPHPFRACTGCRLAHCISKGICQNPFR